MMGVPAGEASATDAEIAARAVDGTAGWRRPVEAMTEVLPPQQVLPPQHSANPPDVPLAAWLLGAAVTAVIVGAAVAVLSTEPEPAPTVATPPALTEPSTTQPAPIAAPVEAAAPTQTAVVTPAPAPAPVLAAAPDASYVTVPSAERIEPTPTQDSRLRDLITRIFGDR